MLRPDPVTVSCNPTPGLCVLSIERGNARFSHSEHGTIYDNKTDLAGSDLRRDYRDHGSIGVGGVLFVGVTLCFSP